MSAILNGDDAILGLIPGNSRTGNGTLFGVYRNAYVLRLVGAVASDHENLKAYLGDDAFDRMAQAYVGANPSRSPNARWFAQRLPEFLRSQPLYRERRELTELASLERALNLAFDAVDQPVIDLDVLRGFAPEQWGSLIFRSQASAQRLTFEMNTYAIWSALKSGHAPPRAEPLAEPQSFLIWRDETTPKIRSMGREEAMMWDEAAKAVPFGALCELVAVFGAPDDAALRAAQYLQSWLSGGLLREVTADGLVAETSV